MPTPGTSWREAGTSPLPGWGTPNIVPADQNGVAFSRTTDGVLKIVYLNAQKQPGGFFPQGLNGQIR